MAIKPYLVNNNWNMDVDPDDESYIVADVTQDLLDRSTTASHVECLVTGVTILEGPSAQGSLMVAKVTMDKSESKHWITFRVRCTNTERFDRTIYFNLEEH